MPSPSLMNASVKCEYALRAVLDLALAASKTEPIRIADIASRQRIPQKFLETILSDLRKRGLLESRRGAEGGYMLARPAETITVGEVVRAVEGGRSLHKSEEPGPIEFLWDELNAAIGAVVDHKTIAELARQWRDRQTQNAPNWEI
ncbi:MAG: Rrf2 family transcriptional regulator [Bryobacteraceae bacterium]|jgi:Rrf2 family protein